MMIIQNLSRLFAALAEAEEIIKADTAGAAQSYIRVEQSKLPAAFIEKMIADPENNFTITPRGRLFMPISCISWEY